MTFDPPIAGIFEGEVELTSRSFGHQFMTIGGGRGMTAIAAHFRCGHGIEAEASRQATRGVTRHFDATWRVKASGEGRLCWPKKDDKRVR